MRNSCKTSADNAGSKARTGAAFPEPGAPMQASHPPGQTRGIAMNWPKFWISVPLVARMRQPFRFGIMEMSSRRSCGHTFTPAPSLCWRSKMQVPSFTNNFILSPAFFVLGIRVEMVRSSVESRERCAQHISRYYKINLCFNTTEKEALGQLNER